MDRFIAEEAAEFFGESQRRWITAGGFFLQTFQADGFQILRDARVKQSRSDWFLVQQLAQRSLDGFADERRASGEQVIEQRAE